MKILVISSDYPGPDFIYGDVFVHTRLKQYLAYAEVAVVGYNAVVRSDRNFIYEGISVCISNNIHTFYNKIKNFNPDVIAAHLINHIYIDYLITTQKPLVIFVHGYEATSWKRRLMNYNSLGAIRYLIPYIKANRKQLSKFKQLVRYAQGKPNIQFVFVSHWLRNAVEKDLNTKIQNARVIPNGIDTSLFDYHSKEKDHRKKILMLRSFKARNYANDLAIDAILLLSKRPCFNDLEFSIYGEGYLFKKLTYKLRLLPNVKLHNYFIENQKIPAIHREHGIFLCPSRMDTQGVSMCEAMASGLVPVTSPIGGIPEYLENGISGLSTSNAEGIAQKIEYLYNHPDQFLKMSYNARYAITTKCSLPDTVLNEIVLMKSIIDAPNQVKYQQCTNCLLDTHDDHTITFNEKGVCIFCVNYYANEKKNVKTHTEASSELEGIVNTIKCAGKDQPYDCILGLSGGVDSTYLALKAKEIGLRPLAVHFDNGWNSESAVSNIEKIVTKLGFDLHTHVIDWDEFRDLQLAFLKASVVDIEMVTDHAIMTSLYKIAIRYRIKFILSGVNYVTESILPPSWIHDKRDHIHIQAINKLFGSAPLQKFPLMNSWLKFRIEWKGIKSIALLNYFPYWQSEVKKRITEELEWRDYGGKHYESVFTRFYQGYILPIKFNIDKRKAHLSNLICSGQITREEALAEIKRPAYSEALQKNDWEFVLKKLGLSSREFEAIMKLPVKRHNEYPIDESIYNRFPLLRFILPAWKMIKRIKQAA